jgi:TRAP-type C4-dicarboxylate transport system substrate-binding protein
VQFFPDNQLGQEIDVVNSVKLGVIDLMVTGTSIWANVVPLIGLLDLGYLFESFPQQTKALDAGAAKPLELALNAGANVHIIGWAYNFGSRSVLCKSAITAPKDLAGKRIRTLPNKIITECLKLMGAAATPMAFGEIYTALQAGVLDGLEHDPPTIVASKFYETAKFYSLTQHNFSALGAFCSGLTLNRMEAPLREQFLTAAAEAAVDTRARGLKAEKEAIDTLKQKGVETIACDREPFRKLTLPDRRLHHGASRGEADHRYRPQHQGLTGSWLDQRPRPHPRAACAGRSMTACPRCSLSSTRSPPSCWRRT